MSFSDPRFLPFGDAAVLVEFGAGVDRAVSARVLALDHAARAAAIPGVVETAPSFRSLMVQFDPLATDLDAVTAALAPLAAAAAASEAAVEAGRSWRLPVCYEGDCALDLAEVAERAGMSRAEVIDLHAGRAHHVYMIGFLPGCPYLGDLPKAIDFPRRATPRLKTPAGAVAIAVGLTVIYPTESPGGWWVLGRTPTPMFDASAASPALLEPGDSVRFEPIGAPRFAELSAAAAAGEWRPAPEGGAAA